MSIISVVDFSGKASLKLVLILLMYKYMFLHCVYVFHSPTTVVGNHRRCIYHRTLLTFELGTQSTRYSVGIKKSVTLFSGVTSLQFMWLLMTMGIRYATSLQIGERQPSYSSLRVWRLWCPTTMPVSVHVWEHLAGAFFTIENQESAKSYCDRWKAMNITQWAILLNRQIWSLEWDV